MSTSRQAVAVAAVKTTACANMSKSAGGSSILLRHLTQTTATARVMMHMGSILGGTDVLPTGNSPTVIDQAPVPASANAAAAAKPKHDKPFSPFFRLQNQNHGILGTSI